MFDPPLSEGGFFCWDVAKHRSGFPVQFVTYRWKNLIKIQKTRTAISAERVRERLYA